MEISVVAFWDPEVKVWTASSEEVSGLISEAPTLDKLATRIYEAGYDLLNMQGAFDREGTTEMNFHIDCDVHPSAKPSNESSKAHINSQVSFNLHDRVLLK